MHFGKEQDIHTSLESNEEHGYGLDLGLLIIMYYSCVFISQEK